MAHTAASEDVLCPDMASSSYSLFRTHQTKAIISWERPSTGSAVKVSDFKAFQSDLRHKPPRWASPPRNQQGVLGDTKDRDSLKL